MSLGVDDRSPSAAEASEMMDGCREWQGLTLTAAGNRELTPPKIKGALPAEMYLNGLGHNVHQPNCL